MVCTPAPLSPPTPHHIHTCTEARPPPPPTQSPSVSDRKPWVQARVSLLPPVHNTPVRWRCLRLDHAEDVLGRAVRLPILCLRRALDSMSTASEALPPILLLAKQAKAAQCGLGYAWGSQASKPYQHGHELHSQTDKSECTRSTRLEDEAGCVDDGQVGAVGIPRGVDLKSGLERVESRAGHRGKRHPSRLSGTAARHMLHAPSASVSPDFKACV